MPVDKQHQAVMAVTLEPMLKYIYQVFFLIHLAVEWY